jgi:hypothetical protein
MIGKCEYCGKENKDLRPYGKHGEQICYSCGMKNIKQTRESFANLTVGRDVIVSDDGIEIVKQTEH